MVKLKVHWLPLWVSNENAKYGEVRKVEHVTENGIITGVRQAELSLREANKERFHIYLICMEINVYLTFQDALQYVLNVRKLDI